MKLANAELRLVLARLLFTFDMRLAEESDRWDWGEQNTYIFWVSDLVLLIKFILTNEKDKRPLNVALRRRSLH